MPGIPLGLLLSRFSTFFTVLEIDSSKRTMSRSSPSTVGPIGLAWLPFLVRAVELPESFRLSDMFDSRYSLEIKIFSL